MDIHSCHVVQARSCAVQLGPGQPKGSALESWCLVVYIYILFVTTANLWPPRSLRIYIYIHVYILYIHIYQYQSGLCCSTSPACTLLGYIRARLLSRILFGKCWPCRRCRQAASRGCQAASKICDCFEGFPRPLGPARLQKHTSSETGSVTRPGSVAVSQPAQTKRSKRLVERGRVSGEDPGISGWGRGGEERQVNKM